MNRPSFQFYPKDWLGNMKIALLSPAEEGAYIRLLCYCWEEDGLTMDNDELAQLSRLGEGWFNGGSTRLLKFFYERDGKWHNKRQDLERKKQDEWRKKSVEGGKRSAELRAKGKGKSKGGSSRPLEPEGNTSSSTSSSTSLKENINKKEKTPKEEMADFIENASVGNFEPYLSQIIEAGIPVDRASDQLKDFYRYWTEPTPNGKQQRWNLEKTFEIRRRLSTWFKNSFNWNKEVSKPSNTFSS